MSIALTVVVIAVNLYFVINQVEALEIEGVVLVVVCKYFQLIIFAIYKRPFHNLMEKQRNTWKIALELILINYCFYKVDYKK